MFHLMPYRELPADFAETYHSVWVDIPSHLFDAERANAMFNDTLDELELAATVGYDGVCVNEHHQNAYGLMPSPNIMAASLARRTPGRRPDRPRQLDRAVQPAAAGRRRVRHAGLHQRRAAHRRASRSAAARTRTSATA